MRMNKLLSLFAAALLLAVSVSVSYAQDPQPNQAQPAGDPIEQLRLTPDQRQRIRVIVERNKEDRQSANRRVREANVVLDQALDAEQIDESVIEQRVNDLAGAQAAQLRLRIRTELQIRRELRPEQLAILHRLRLQVRDVMTGQRPLDRRTIREGLRPNQRNGAFPRRNIP